MDTSRIHYVYILDTIIIFPCLFFHFINFRVAKLSLEQLEKEIPGTVVVRFLFPKICNKKEPFKKTTLKNNI
nr:MAG TPA: hypothetical protein [Caudoviricetes sp.]